jgi:SRSO17 transposase
MDVPASPAELPEWHACVGAFQGRCRRPEGRHALERDTTGRLTELPKQHGDPIAQAVPGTRAQRVQECLTPRPWAAEDRNHQRVQKMVAEATRDDGVLVVDETGVPTQGLASVGGERQSAGTLGTGGNCHIAGTWCDTAPPAMWPVAVPLSWPKTWACVPARRPQAPVPAEVACPTKPEMALARREQARAWGVPQRGVVADADDGEHPNGLRGLEARQDREVVAGRTAFRVRMGPTATTPVWQTDQLRPTVPRGQWRTMRWRRGPKGWRRQQLVAVPCWRVPNDGQRHVGWLLGERAPQGPPEARQDSWSHVPAAATLEALAG